MASVMKILIIIGTGIIGYLILHFVMGYLEKPKHPRTAIIINVVGVIALIAALAGGYFYFFVLSPTFIEKPYMEKPSLYVENASTREEVIKEEHIRYLVNEMGGYRLHNDPISKTPAEFEFFVNDFNKTYAIRTSENNILVWVGALENPDGRVYTKQETVIRIFLSSNFKKELVRYVKEGKIRAELIADETTLALKGYKTVYDEFK